MQQISSPRFEGLGGNVGMQRSVRSLRRLLSLGRLNWEMQPLQGLQGTIEAFQLIYEQSATLKIH